MQLLKRIRHPHTGLAGGSLRNPVNLDSTRAPQALAAEQQGAGAAGSKPQHNRRHDDIRLFASDPDKTGIIDGDNAPVLRADRGAPLLGNAGKTVGRRLGQQMADGGACRIPVYGRPDLVTACRPILMDGWRYVAVLDGQVQPLLRLEMILEP